MGAGLIGDISLLYGPHRSTMRSTPNPYDKSSVISIYPKKVYENKPTIQPGEFTIPVGSYEKPSILIVGPSSWWKDSDPTQPDSPLLEITNSSWQVAESIVKDYCNGIYQCNMNDSMPGLLAVPGPITLEDIKSNKKVQIGATEISVKLLVDRAQARQKKWFENLVAVADAWWISSNGNPLSISSDMKMAAKELNLTNKEWLTDSVITQEMIRCVSCGAMRDPKFPICGVCRTIIDRKKYDELGLTTQK